MYYIWIERKIFFVTPYERQIVMHDVMQSVKFDFRILGLSYHM